MSAEELYYNTFRNTLRFLFQKVGQGEVKLDDTAQHWQESWLGIAVKSHLDDDTTEAFQRQGLNALVNVHSALVSELSIINLEIPWECELKPLDTTVRGRILALLSGSLDGKGASSDLYIVDTIPPYVGLRISKAGLKVFNFPRGAIASEIRPLTRNYKVRTLLIDPNTGHFRRVDPAHRDELLPIVGVTVNQMMAQLTLPNYGAGCQSCPFSSVCSPSHLNGESVDAPNKTKEKIEEAQWLVNSDLSNS